MYPIPGYELLKGLCYRRQNMDLIRSRVRPQTLVPPPLPASQAPAPEGTGTLGLRGELGENAAAFFFGDGGSASIIPTGTEGPLCHSRPASVLALLPTEGNGRQDGAQPGPW